MRRGAYDDDNEDEDEDDDESKLIFISSGHQQTFRAGPPILTTFPHSLEQWIGDDDDDYDDDDDNDDDDDDDMAGEDLMSALHPGVEPGTFLRFDDMIWMMMSLIIIFIRCSLVAASSWWRHSENGQHWFSYMILKSQMSMHMSWKGKYHAATMF